MPSTRTVTFSNSTKMPAKPNPDHIQIVPDTDVRLRNCGEWIPVQVYDIIYSRLSPTTTSPWYRTFPYKALIRDLSDITSYPVTPDKVAEIHEIRRGRPGLPKDATKDEKDMWELRQALDQTIAEHVIIQRSSVAAAKRAERLQKKANAANAIPSPLKTSSRRAAEAEVALDQAQARARKMQVEAEGILDEARKKGIVPVGVIDEKDKRMESGWPSPSDAPPRKKLRSGRTYQQNLR